MLNGESGAHTTYYVDGEMAGWHKHVYHDGGRAETKFKGTAGDCVTRAIAIATGLPYIEVYDELAERNSKIVRRGKRSKKKNGVRSARNGVNPKAYKPYLAELGWEWVPTMKFGEGCTVHVRTDELPEGMLILRLSKHLAAFKDGELYDTYDGSREGTRCVYGYWSKRTLTGENSEN